MVFRSTDDLTKHQREWLNSVRAGTELTHRTELSEEKCSLVDAAGTIIKAVGDAIT